MVMSINGTPLLVLHMNTINNERQPSNPFGGSPRDSTKPCLVKHCHSTRGLSRYCVVCVVLQECQVIPQTLHLPEARQEHIMHDHVGYTHSRVFLTLASHVIPHKICEARD